MSIYVTQRRESPDIVECNFAGNWSWPDLHQMLLHINQIVHNSPKNITLFVDLRNSHVPTGLPSSEANPSAFVIEKVQTAIVIGDLSYDAGMVAFIFKHIYGLSERFFFVESLEKAESILKSQRTTAYHSTSVSQV